MFIAIMITVIILAVSLACLAGKITSKNINDDDKKKYKKIFTVLLVVLIVLAISSAIIVSLMQKGIYLGVVH